MDMAPTLLAQAHTPNGRAELVEWQWPTMVNFARSETDLMIEMSLPPFAADASACLPQIDPNRRCIMGTLFLRWPDVMISGRAEGGHIRVVRCVFSGEQARLLMAGQPDPDAAFIRSLLAIRNEPLRTLMHLLRRELSNPLDRSAAAVAALVDLIAVELGRLIRLQTQRASTAKTGTGRTGTGRTGTGRTGTGPTNAGRLAAWQFRRIRERLSHAGPAPGVAELAALCGISTRHLHRQFLALTGATVADYVEATRIEQAKRLLDGRDHPIKAIAQACGFAHANSFARAFRRSTGLNPLAFRQRGHDSAALITTY